MRRVIGMDIHRTFGEVVFWEATVSVSVIVSPAMAAIVAVRGFWPDVVLVR